MSVKWRAWCGVRRMLLLYSSSHDGGQPSDDDRGMGVNLLSLERHNHRMVRRGGSSQADVTHLYEILSGTIVAMMSLDWIRWLSTMIDDEQMLLCLLLGFMDA